MKKRLLILAAMVIAMATLVGCGKEKSPEEKLAEEFMNAMSNSSKEEESAADSQAYRSGYTYEDGVLKLYTDQGNYNFQNENKWFSFFIC